VASDLRLALAEALERAVALRTLPAPPPTVLVAVGATGALGPAGERGATGDAGPIGLDGPGRADRTARRRTSPQTAIGLK